jgi:hypothetical protein
MMTMPSACCNWRIAHAKESINGQEVCALCCLQAGGMIGAMNVLFLMGARSKSCAPIVTFAALSFSMIKIPMTVCSQCSPSSPTAMANPEGTVSHLWRTENKRKLRKSTIQSFQTLKPQFQNYDGVKAVCFWIQIQVFGHYAPAFRVDFNIPLCLLSRQAWQRPQMPKRGRRKEFKQNFGQVLGIWKSHEVLC